MIKLAICLSYLFLFSELILMLTKRSKHKLVKRKRDRGSLIILWLTITVCLTLGFNLANYTIWSTGDYLKGSLGFLFACVGFILRWTSIIQLKEAFTVDVAVSETQKLKTDGLFKVVRHPSYLGLLLILGGFSLVMGNLLSILIVTIPVIAAILYRISVEESLLKGEFGKKYLDYMGKTRKIIPLVY